jgi:hypothetical protein
MGKNILGKIGGYGDEKESHGDMIHEEHRSPRREYCSVPARRQIEGKRKTKKTSRWTLRPRVGCPDLQTREQLVTSTMCIPCATVCYSDEPLAPILNIIFRYRLIRGVQRLGTHALSVCVFWWPGSLEQLILFRAPIALLSRPTPDPGDPPSGFSLNMKPSLSPYSPTTAPAGLLVTPASMAGWCTQVWWIRAKLYM